MKVIFVARENIINPYIALLIRSLKTASPKNSEFIYYSSEAISEPAPDEEIILHIHWPETIYESDISNRSLKTRFLAALRVLKFLYELRNLKARKKTRIVWTVHNYKSHRNWFPLIEDFLCWNLYRYADRFIVHTPAGKNFLFANGIPENKISVIAHGTYRQYYGAPRNAEESRKELGINKNAIVFLNFGILRRYKRIDCIRSVFNRLSSEKRIKLFVAGKVPKDKVASFFTAADFFVMGHQNFLTSGTAVLALSYGLPVIAPSSGDMPYIIRNGENGFLYGTDDELQELISAVSNFPDAKKNKMRNNAMKSVAKHSWKFVAKETLAVYRRENGPQ